MRQHYEVLQPCFGTQSVDVIVVAELVAFDNTAVGIVEVVLQVVRSEGDVTVREWVDIKPELAAQEVAHCLVVHALGVVERHTSLKRHKVVHAVVEVRVEHEVKLVVGAVLKYVRRAFFVGFRQCLVLYIVEFINSVEFVPVDLTGIHVVEPTFGIEVEQFLVVGVIRRQVAVVCRIGVIGLIVLQGRTVVVYPAGSHGGIDLYTVFLEQPVEHHGGVVCFGDSARTLLAVLISPEGVVEV